MNRRHCALATLIVTLGSAGAWGQARGATGTPTAAPTAAAASSKVATRPASTAVAAPVTVPPAAYTAPAANRPVIVNFVTLNVTNLLNDSDTNAQTNARNNLTAATTTAGAPASPAFLFEYAMALNNAFITHLGPKANSTVRQRLNIGIVTARVAYASQNVALQQTTILLINDPAEPVVLWGLKAAQPQMPLVLQTKIPGQQIPPLLAAIKPAVFKHPSGPVFAEAYEALTAVDPQVVQQLVMLWGNRLGQYQAKELPDDPAVDGLPVFTLTTSQMWTKVLVNNALQTKAMQMISDQISVAAQWADQTPAGEKHDQLVKLAVPCAQGCVVVGGNLKNQGLVTAATPLANIKVETLPAGTKIVPMVSPGIVDAIKAAFPGVQPPPPVGAAAAAKAAP
jgi:adenosyl cobinamide kinase/adenosyl cobinamide phosphate guanylyltransferase